MTCTDLQYMCYIYHTPIMHVELLNVFVVIIDPSCGNSLDDIDGVTTALVNVIYHYCCNWIGDLHSD